jgi:hypothetical protein
MPLFSRGINSFSLLSFSLFDELPVEKDARSFEKPYGYVFCKILARITA